MAKAHTTDGSLLDLGGGAYQLAASGGYTANSACPFINGVAQICFTETDASLGIFTFDAEVAACIKAGDDICLVYDDPNAVITAILEGPIVGVLSPVQRITASLGSTRIAGQLVPCVTSDGSWGGSWGAAWGGTLSPGAICSTADNRITGQLQGTRLVGRLGGTKQIRGVISCP